MKIQLHFPTEAIRAIDQMGLRQRNPERLRWTTEHPASHYHTGVILRGNSGDMLDGQGFAGLHEAFGAWIECDSADTKRKVQNALVTVATELDDAIKINAGQ